MFRLFLFLTLLLVSAPLRAAEAPVEFTFEEGVAAYKAGNTDAAVKILTGLADAGHLSAALCHNLGNLEFRRGNKGAAALWYRRALVLDPLLAEAKQNLRVTARQTGMQQFDTAGVSVAWLPERPLTAALAVSGWLTVILILWLVWWSPRRGRRWPLVTLLCLALPVFAASVTLRILRSRDTRPALARHVVTAEGVISHTAPAEASPAVLPLPPGSELVPLETRGNWVYCDMPTADPGEPLRGWVRAASLTPLWPWPAPTP